MASVIQKFDLSLVDPSYTLQIKQTLTVKPKGLYIHAAPRAGKVSLLATPSSALIASRHDELGVSSGSAQAENAGTGVGLPLYVLYGSNTGTSEAFAQRVANEAPSYGALFLFSRMTSLNFPQDSVHRSVRWIPRWGRFRRMGP